MLFRSGLVHGFGFASALTELDLPRTTLVWALAGFNLGVEIGQAALVVLLLPIAWYCRNRAFYHRSVLRGGSAAIAAVAALWFAERAFDLALIPSLP